MAAGIGPIIFDRLLPLLAATADLVAVPHAFVVLATPHVRRMSWLLGATSVVFIAAAALVASRPGARRRAWRWGIPLAAFAVGWPIAAGTVTWSHPKSGLGVFLMAFLLLVAVDLGLLVMSLVAVVWNWKVGTVGLLVIGLTWTAILVTPEDAVRRLRIELAGPALEDEARRVLEDPALARDMGPFVAEEEGGDGRVVGWLIGAGFLGRGPGLIWDPDGVLYGDGFARTEEGYPWFLYGTACEPIVDDWIYCNMR